MAIVILRYFWLTMMKTLIFIGLTPIFQVMVRRPLPCSLTHNLVFQFSFSGVVITITPSISLGTKTLLTELTYC